MRRIIEERIRDRRKVAGPLPSIRELATEFGASTRTVHAALGSLAAEGVVHSIDRKGFFWGTVTAEDRLRAESREDRFATRFLTDLRQGVFHPWKALPPRKALGEVYGVGQKCVGRVLGKFERQGILEFRGREIFFSSPSKSAPSTSVLVVVRCDSRGAFILDSEREIDALKSIRRELADQGLGMVRIGYFEGNGGRFLDHSGLEVQLPRIRTPLLGGIVSTWLVSDPAALLGKLRALTIPLSVWWEHPPEMFPGNVPHDDVVGFNLAFGESAGVLVGRHLAYRGSLDVAFVSPFHGNTWSPARLRGLQTALHAFGGSVLPFLAPEIHSPWHLQRTLEASSSMEDALEGVLKTFLEDPELWRRRTWVVVNDLTATTLHRMIVGRTESMPSLISFDNTSDSERLGIDSFEFHTEGMVRQMIHHLRNPKAQIFRRSRVQEMVGRLVQRSPPEPSFASTDRKQKPRPDGVRKGFAPVAAA